MNRHGLALDSKSVRHYDVDGRLHVEKSHISKAIVNPYYGYEIPGSEALGLDANTVYFLLRDPDELAKSAPTFNNLPILIKHKKVTSSEPEKDLVVGSIGSDVTFNAPYLDASLCFWDDQAIAGIESDTQRELSAAYAYVPVMNSGTYDGQHYDGVMTEIKGNHLALVEAGRAGNDVLVFDENPFKKEELTVKVTKLGKALMVSLSAASPKIAQDSALPALVGDAKKATFDKKNVISKLIALDTELSPEKVDSIIDAILGVEQDPEAKEPEQITGIGEDEDEGGVEKFLQEKLSPEDYQAYCEMVKPAEDEFPEKDGEKKDDKEECMSKEEVTHAMDSMRKSLRDEFKQLEQAKSDVRKVVGDVLGMDSASDVYRFALKQQGITAPASMDVAGLRTLFDVASSKKSEIKPAPLAMDGETVKMFPNLNRFMM